MKLLKYLNTEKEILLNYVDYIINEISNKQLETQDITKS